MNELYITILSIIVVATVIHPFIGDGIKTGSFREGLLISSFFISLVLIVFSFVLPLGDKLVDTKNAKNTRVGNEFIITSEYPTQIVTDVKFEDANVVVEKIIPRNAWGINLKSSTTYKVKIADKK